MAVVPVVCPCRRRRGLAHPGPTQRQRPVLAPRRRLVARSGIRCERFIADNGSCYRSRCWNTTCASTSTKVKKTRCRRPQTNGKIERLTGSCSKSGPTSARGSPTPTAPPATPGSFTLQSLPFPGRSRLGHTHRDPQPPPRGHPPRGAQRGPAVLRPVRAAALALMAPSSSSAVPSSGLLDADQHFV